MKQRMYVDGFKEQALGKVLGRSAGQSVRSIAADLGMNLGTLRGWMKQALRDGRSPAGKTIASADWTPTQRLLALHESHGLGEEPQSTTLSRHISCFPLQESNSLERRSGSTGAAGSPHLPTLQAMACNSSNNQRDVNARGRWHPAMNPAMPRLKSYRTALVATVLILTVFGLEAAPASDTRIARVENGLLPVAATRIGAAATIHERMAAYGVSGLSVAVIDAGRIAWAKGYGVADAATGKRVTTATLFQAASISKPITAMGVLALAQKGLLRLDDDVNGQLKSWHIPENDFTRAVRITPRMLLNHSAGVEFESSGGYAPGDKLPTTVQILDGIQPAHNGPIKVMARPGQSFRYSGAGYLILQQLIMDASGESFESFMQSNVLTRSGMTNSTFAQPLSESLQENAATGYYAGGQPIPGRFRVAPELAVAGLWSTPSDIAKYVIQVQQSYSGSANQLLASSLTRDMLNPGLGRRGLGPTISGSGDSIRFGHDGFNEGFESAFVGYLNGGRGAVVMANSGFSFMLIEEVLDSIGRAYGWPSRDSTSQRPPAAEIRQQLVTSVPADKLASAAGKYRFETISIDIYARGNQLFLRWPGNGEAEIFMVDAKRAFCPPLIFSDVGSPWLILAPDSGRVDSILAGDDGSLRFSRVDAIRPQL